MSAGASTRRPDRAAMVIAALLGGLAVLIFWQTWSMPAGAHTTRVGPTTLPYVLSGFLALLAVGHVFSALRHGMPERDDDRVGPMLWIVGGLVAQMLLLTSLGFAIATGVLFACTARGFGKGPLWITVPFGVVVSLVIWLIFSGLLNLSLPAGPLERLFL